MGCGDELWGWAAGKGCAEGAVEGGGDGLWEWVVGMGCGDGLWGWVVGMGCGKRRGQLTLRRLLT